MLEDGKKHGKKKIGFLSGAGFETFSGGDMVRTSGSGSSNL